MNAWSFLPLPLPHAGCILQYPCQYVAPKILSKQRYTTLATGITPRVIRRWQRSNLRRKRLHVRSFRAVTRVRSRFTFCESRTCGSAKKGFITFSLQKSANERVFVEDKDWVGSQCPFEFAFEAKMNKGVDGICLDRVYRRIFERALLTSSACPYPRSFPASAIPALTWKLCKVPGCLVQPSYGISGELVCLCPVLNEQTDASLGQDPDNHTRLCSTL